MNLLHETAIFLGAAIIAVPLFQRLGFGSVLGYLAAGVVIGPWGLSLVSGVDTILHFAELGVVFLLFIIGLELQPSRLWVLRKSIFGLGLTQVLVTGLVLASIGFVVGLRLESAILAGLGLSLSSTAFVLQMLAERKQLPTAHGRAAFSILLFQDLAVIPLLALVPFLGTAEAQDQGGNMALQVSKLVVVLIGFVFGGRFLLRHLFRLITAHASHEIFTAAALLVVIGAASLMEFVGASMALGAFLAGVLLADSEYRHALEADIEPFKGLLLGLFFIAVGMSANIGLVTGQPLLVLAVVAGLLAAKFIVLLVLGRLFGLNSEASRNLAFTLPQGGEFAFVLFSAALVYEVLDRGLAELLILVVTLTMAMTPLLVSFNERVLKRWLGVDKPRAFDRIEESDHQVVIAGFGRFGQIIGRILRVRNIPFTALEANPSQVDFVRKYGSKIYYGDASRLDLLRAARADKANLFVLAIDDMTASIRTAETVQKHFPGLSIYARARNRRHAHLLMDLGIKVITRETFLSALELAEHVLHGLGLSERVARDTVATFKDHDEKTMLEQHAIHHDETMLIQTVKEAAAELEELFRSDVEDIDEEAAPVAR
ncbi:MAG: monovalent cation:proton antiporter-2 (CPA2) family protein [Gammaproteobacteria bacterium]|nr:monovalent cation:proton antiporter-2 (CPA2) family protein [Gammaproteobacteria bacterium]